METKSNNKFTLKIVLSYLVLALLAIGAGYFIFSEIGGYLTSEREDRNDTKLLKTSSLLTQIYEAESLSELAFQLPTKENLTSYSNKIDSIFIKIDTLKQLTENTYQKGLLDSVQTLLLRKVTNGNDLHNLKIKGNSGNNSFDTALKELDKIEESFGTFSVENLFPNFHELSPKIQNTLSIYADLINSNTPKKEDVLADRAYVDSLLKISKNLMAKAKRKDLRAQQSLAQKEIEINRNNLVLSQQLRSIITAFEQEVIINSYNDSIQKQAALRKSIRLAGLAAIIGFIIVSIFTFLLTRDFWTVQAYRNKLEKEKKFSESLLKSREQLISTVSHDLRTPLNTILGYSELMESNGLTDKQLVYLNNVRSASQYVDRLVNDLLDFSKLEAGKIKIEKKPFNLSILIRETAESIKHIYKDVSIELLIDIDEQLNTAVLSDPLRIRQILTNLISNAFKFTEQGFVKVEANLKKEGANKLTAIIKIIDTGIGIKKEKQHLIFKEFTQAEDHTDKKYGGYGLGLTISKKLSQLLSGSLTLSSEEGKGSAFTLHLPIEISEVVVRSLHDPLDISSHPTKSISLLIIDDDPAMLHLLAEVCLTMGVKTHTYLNFDSLPKTKKLNYNMVLTDLQMPKIDGIEVLNRLQKGDYIHYKDQPVILMSGKRDLPSEDLKKAGFSQMLQKPFTKAQLMTVLNKFFPSHFETDYDENQPKIVEKESKLFNLDIISSFLAENREAMNEVLETFIKDTKNNINQLKIAMDNSDYNSINNIAHRMLPMFRQLKVETCIPELEKLEILRKENKLEETYYTKLAGASYQLVSALEEYLAKSPSYSD